MTTTVASSVQTAAIAASTTANAATTSTTATATTTTVALVTVFTAPSSCSSSWTYEASTYNGISSGLLLQNAISEDIDGTCFPPGFDQSGRVFEDQIFSPGACPDHYTTHTPLQVSGAITTAACCLKNFTFYTSSDYQGCLSTFTGSTSVAARAGGFGSSDYTTSTTISGTYTMWGLPIVIEYQSSDLSLYTTATATSTTSTTSTTSAAPSTQSSSSSSGLSTGAKAGIAVGAVVGALLLLGLFGFWLRRSRAEKRRQITPIAPETTSQPAELYQDQVYEAPANENAVPIEADSTAVKPAQPPSVVAELP
ncbi:hypothetical protein ASPZODRAFT_142797 [Penicilliopsis zonata CBS 506.65]|uniref:Mid2 domain-containing protein n=1 Tax=Penicilliopsis zonata CBS 506.65 TaxID=1073090 RepID=A0A1L9SGJ8_9EURO|nr:hypothetical protein ASPZODRAFT_142797 [Penicilliopsis zonata CBS 506.65]OJJ46174.1 hypothetical protein ASPZODRAFT_142797 [Penicilliopsis zonata CBS 506.65]